VKQPTALSFVEAVSIWMMLVRASDGDSQALDQLTGTPGKRATFYAAVPLKRGAMLEEIADAIMFLDSSKS
jgi:hypothetical protein